MTDRPDDLGIMTGSFALDAVDDEERAGMDAALLESAELRSEVESLRETALLLAYATEPIEPPRDLKAALMAKIAATPQLPPLETPVASGPASDTTGREARHAPAAHVASSVGAAESTARRRWFQRPGALLAAAAAVVIVAGGGFLGGNLVNSGSQNTGSPQASTSQSSSAQLDKIYAAADFERTTTPVTGGGTATVVWSDSLAKSAVILTDVKSVPSDKTYELWYIGAKIVPAGTFNTARSGVTTTVLTGKKTKDATVGLTVEPAGGSKQPTTKPIVAVPTTATSTSSAERANSSDPPGGSGASSTPPSTASSASTGESSATSSDVASGVSGAASSSGSTATGQTATVQTPVVGGSVSAGASGVGVSASTPAGVGADASVGSSGVGATVTTPLGTGVDAGVSGSGTSVGVQTPLGNVGVQLPTLGR
jgi:anti-sigma-K factor RskA